MIRALGLAALLALAVLIAGAQEAPPPRTITVTGEAERMVSPDVGIVVIAVETRGDTVAAASMQNNTVTTRVMTAIRQLNIAQLTMRTIGFDVEPVYEQPAEGRPMPIPPRIVGYRVINRFQTRIPNADPTRLSTDVGRVIDAAIAAGANRVDMISFSLANPSRVMRELLAEATVDARENARAIAMAAGVTIVRLQSLVAGTAYAPPPSPVLARQAEAAIATPIEAGQLTLRVTVSASYQLR